MKLFDEVFKINGLSNFKCICVVLGGMMVYNIEYIQMDAFYGPTLKVENMMKWVMAYRIDVELFINSSTFDCNSFKGG